MKTRISLIKRILSLTLVLVFALPLLASCESRAIPAGELALTEVGTVGGRSVLYEELYFLACNDLPAIKAKHGEDIEAIRAELAATVSEQIVQNYARLSLCEDMGLTFDENELADEAQSAVDAIIAQSFEDDRNAYIEALAEVGMTDHYFRFTAKVDALYSRLTTVYAERGLVPVENKDIRNYVKENFVRTRHVAVLVEEGESYEENYAKAEEALAMLERGEPMNKVIGSKYNEDLTTVSLNGHYFTRGSMDQVYEDAAYALEENTHSDIIVSRGESNLTSKTVTCFYIIERLPLEEGYINSHLTELSDKCTDSIISADLDKKLETIAFTPNEFFGTLDLTNLEFPEDGIDWALILIIVAIVLAVSAIVVVAVILLRRRHLRRREKVVALMRK